MFKKVSIGLLLVVFMSLMLFPAGAQELDPIEDIKLAIDVIARFGPDQHQLCLDDSSLDAPDDFACNRMLAIANWYHEMNDSSNYLSQISIWLQKFGNSFAQSLCENQTTRNGSKPTTCDVLTAASEAANQTVNQWNSDDYLNQALQNYNPDDCSEDNGVPCDALSVAYAAYSQALGQKECNYLYEDTFSETYYDGEKIMVDQLDQVSTCGMVAYAYQDSFIIRIYVESDSYPQNSVWSFGPNNRNYLFIHGAGQLSPVGAYIGETPSGIDYWFAIYHVESIDKFLGVLAYMDSERQLFQTTRTLPTDHLSEFDPSEMKFKGELYPTIREVTDDAGTVTSLELSGN